VTDLTDIFVGLVERTVEKCFDGQLVAREYDSVLLGAMLAALVPENIPEEMKNMLPANLWPAVQANVAQGLLTAVDCLRRQQENAQRMDKLMSTAQKKEAHPKMRPRLCLAVPRHNATGTQ